MGTPVDQSQIEKFRSAHAIFRKFHDLVSSMLEVNGTQIEQERIPIPCGNSTFILGGSEEKTEDRSRGAGNRGNFDFDPGNPEL